MWRVPFLHGQYSQNRANTVPELQQKLADMGTHVGTRVLDLGFVRDKNFKRELKFLNVLLYIKTNLWKTWFGKEADKLEKANEDERTYYIIEREPLVNKFIPVPKDKGTPQPKQSELVCTEVAELQRMAAHNRPNPWGQSPLGLTMAKRFCLVVCYKREKT